MKYTYTEKELLQIEQCRQETYTYPGCTQPGCKGRILTISQLTLGKCAACLEKGKAK